MACTLFPKLEFQSVDSSKDWVAKISKNECIKQAVESGRGVLHTIDIGETGHWGYPVNDSKRHSWREYSESYEKYNRNETLILIDGRFRVASALIALEFSPPGSTIIIHDFFSRSHYHDVLKFTNIFDCTKELVILRRKRNLNQTELVEFITRFKEDTKRYL